MTTLTQSPAYSTPQKLLHWTTVGLLLVQYLLLDGMGRPFRQLMESGSPSYDLLVILHIAVGLSVLACAAARLVLRARHGAPTPPEGEPKWARTLGRITHGALYVLLFALPLSGFIAWFGAVGPAAGAHETMTTLLLVVAGLHVGGVAVHQFVWRTGLLARMI